MRLLLDDCLQKDLAREIPGHTVKTVPQAGWASNGELLRLIADSNGFDIFVTVNKSLPHQQKIKHLSFAIVLLRAQSNRLIHVSPFAPEILRRLSEFQLGHVYVLSHPA